MGVREDTLTRAERNDRMICGDVFLQLYIVRIAPILVCNCLVDLTKVTLRVCFTEWIIDKTALRLASSVVVIPERHIQAGMCHVLWIEWHTNDVPTFQRLTDLYVAIYPHVNSPLVIHPCTLGILYGLSKA